MEGDFKKSCRCIKAAVLCPSTSVWYNLKKEETAGLSSFNCFEILRADKFKGKTKHCGNAVYQIVRTSSDQSS